MSVRNSLLKSVLRASRKRIYTSEEALRQHVARSRERQNGHLPESIGRSGRIERGIWDGVTTYTVSPREGSGENGHVLYLHGGGFFEGMNAPRWRMVSTLADGGGVTFTVPLYPLAPEHSHRDTYPWLLRLYDHLCATEKPENLTVMGDSAGGGMALSLVQQAVARGHAQPRQTVLLSPWLDLTLRNPSIAEREVVDPVLASVGLRVAAGWWAGGDDPASPVLSPINGSLRGIGPVLVAIGTDDLLHPDTVVFRDRARAAGIDIEFVEEEGAAHLFMLMPIPEAKPVIDRLVERLQG